MPNQEITNLRPPSTSRPTSIGDDLRETVNGLFATLKTAYPHFLKDQDEKTTKRIWAAHLESYSREAIETASIEMVDAYPKFPPTLGEFKMLLRDLNKVKPGTAIGIDEVCSNCRASRKSQHHADNCQ